MKKKAIIAGATGVLCGFLYTAVKKNKAKNIEEEKENTDNVIVVGFLCRKCWELSYF